MATARMGHGDRKGRHYYITSVARSPCIVVATLAVAMLHPAAYEKPWHHGFS